MKIKGNTVLITSGATGIGFALAEAFVKEGNDVIICVRRESKLEEAKKILPGVHTIRCDITEMNDRFGLYYESSYEPENGLKSVNIFVNNAGIGRVFYLKEGDSNLMEDEIYTNLMAPIRLSSRFIPYMLKHEEAAIINISSGLAFVPMAAMPIYCATKAAMHSFSVSLRHQLKDTSVKGFEVMPPIVDTDFHKDARDRMKERSIPASLVAEETMRSIENDIYEVPVGMSKNLRMTNTDNFDEIFQGMNR